jgi:isopenicillin N synthase-like dioxygenase
MQGRERPDPFAASVALPREQIPNLDLTPLFQGDHESRAILMEEIKAACLDPGFFYVHSTCVSQPTITAALEAARSFFDSDDQGPLKQNVHNRFGGQMKGWGPIFGEPAYQKDTIAHVESFDIGQQLSPERYGDLEIEPNLWPDIPGFQGAVLEYYDAITELGRALSAVFSQLIGEDQEFINTNSGESAPRTLRMLHYPARESPPDSRHVGIAAHTDFECFTILHQTAPGLELTNTAGQWCQAPSDIGHFTIILGDMLERFTNGKLKATGHRVAITPWVRYSMILFFALDGSYTVRPLERFTSDHNPARYPAISQDEHIETELARASSHE